MNLTWTLDTRLRGTGQALDDGRLDPAQVRLIADETAVLDDDALFPRAEEIILAGLAGCATWTALQRLAQRAVLTVDPEGARRRREKAEREHARLRFWRESWGTCAMQATGLPADEALAANARIEGRARAYKAARVARPMDILRVMAYLDLINQVTIAQRTAWAQAGTAARNTEEDREHERGQAARDAALRNAPGNVRRRPPAGQPGQHPEAGEGPGGDAPDGGSPGGSPGPSPSGGPDGDTPGHPGDGGPDGSSSPDGNGPQPRRQRRRAGRS